MFILTNKAEVKKRVFRNRLMFWLGVVGLIGSMITLIVSTSIPGTKDPVTGVTQQNSASTYVIFFVGYPLLIAGVILSKRGSFNNKKFGRAGYKTQAEEKLIDEQLKGVPPRYHLYNYLTISGIPIEHLLVTPQGFVILHLKGQLGKLKAGRDLYRLKRGFVNFLGTIGEPGLGNPSQELSRQVKRLRSFFEAKGYDIPVDGVVVLTNPLTTIEAVEDMSFPVCLLKDLRLAIKEWQTELSMTSEEQLEVEKLLVQQLPAEEATPAEELLTMPASKRALLLAAEEKAEAEKLVKAEKPKKPEKPQIADKTKKPVTTSNVPQPGQRLGLNGKPLPPKTVVDKPKKRATEPLRKPNPGAFGDPSSRKK